MANTIKLKRASGSDPGASDLVVGEVALRTDTAKLFTKKDDNSVAEIGVTALGNNDVTTSTIADNAVTFAKLEDVENNRILGRVSSGAGNAEELTQSQVRTLLNVENGATADQTASEILTLIKTVDGSGSGLDADTLDGISSASFVRSDASDTLTGATYTLDSSTAEKIILSVSTDPFIRFQEGTTDKAFIQWNSAGFLRLMNQEDDSVLRIKDDIEFSQNNSTYHKVWHGGNDGSGSGLDADLLDGQEGSYYRNAGNINAGTLAAARVATLNQNTTGSAATLTTARTIAGVSFDGSANISLNNNAITNGAGYITSSGTSAACSGNAATATKLASARTIAGVSFDGSANISLNNNAITNGAGYITSANGGNAATLDSIDSSQFLRSDTADTASGELTITGGLNFGADAKCAAGVSSLSDGSTITVPFNSGVHHTVTLGGNRTFGDPGSTSGSIGQSGSIFIVQDGTGSRTASFHSDYKFAGGTAPTLSTAANAVDRLDYVIRASDNVHCVVTLDVK